MTATTWGVLHPGAMGATQGATEEELWAIQCPLQASVFTSDDAKEGPAAFAQKRDPNWTGT